uniref:Wsv324-like protein n=1 Tax=Sesarmops intermedium nimavirus TaxID=2133796 RepID=A0A401IPR8_9VIRU|nr:MAG: wsv324-like protein [Sesarmops intermedium nimavirus]GBG35590.1 wsv324-like protein [Sesarmops intermedium nimavirus]
MDDLPFLAKVVETQQHTAARCSPIIRTNMVYREQHPMVEGGRKELAVYLLSMDSELMKKASGIYTPSVPVICNVNCNIWKFVSCTNMARK